MSALEHLPFDKQLQAIRIIEEGIAAIPDDVDPERVARVYHGYVDEDIRDNSVQFKDTPISCKKGCSHCCYMHVDVAVPEAEILARYVLPEDMELLEEQSRHNFDTWLTLPHEKRKCIFLRNGECSVYENRPITCRKYFVITPSEDCDSSKDYPGTDGKVGMAVYWTSELYAAILMQRYQCNTMPHLIYNILKHKTHGNGSTTTVGGDRDGSSSRSV